MTKYYKGTIKNLHPSSYYITRMDEDILHIQKEITWCLDGKIKIDSPILKIVMNYESEIIERKKVNYFSPNEINILNDFFNNTVNRQHQYPIIYEIVNDEFGNTYGKEIISGLIFPISFPEDNKTTYEIKDKSYKYVSYIEHKLYIEETPKYNHPNYQQISNIITNQEYANELDLENYKNRFTNSFNHKQKLKKHLKKLSSSYKTNIFNIKPTINEKKSPTLEQDDTIKIMENIEYLLIKLANHNKQLYNKYKLEYQTLISDDNHLKIIPMDIKTLKILENKLEIELTDTKGNASNIIEYLSNLKQEYLINFLTNNEKKSNITIDEIDKLYEKFLLISNNYSLSSQRKIFRDFALIYLLEIKENITYINQLELTKSYFSKLLKSIIIVINSLNNLDVIEPISIDLFNQVTLENIISIISSIQFKKYQSEEVKELIKKIS